MKKTKHLKLVASELLRNPNQQHWGYELRKSTGKRSGVLYPMLTRLLEAGWLIDGWEDPAATEGRPPRRYYKLTELGKRELEAIVRT